MGISKDIQDQPIYYGFMIDYDKKHGKYDDPFDLMAIEITDAPVRESLKDAIALDALYTMLETSIGVTEELAKIIRRYPSPGTPQTCT